MEEEGREKREWKEGGVPRLLKDFLRLLLRVFQISKENP